MVLTTEKIPSLSVPHVSLNDTPGVIEVDSEVRVRFLKIECPPTPRGSDNISVCSEK